MRASVVTLSSLLVLSLSVCVTLCDCPVVNSGDAGYSVYASLFVIIMIITLFWLAADIYFKMSVFEICKDKADEELTSIVFVRADSAGIHVPVTRYDHVMPVGNSSPTAFELKLVPG